jgi:hypothetical protein
VDKNNYPTYTKQVDDINEMYNNRTDYGGEFLRSVLDTRVAFLIGEGLTIKSNDKRLVKWINEFLDFNKLRGSKLLDVVLIGEMEGKCLLVLQDDKKNKKVKVRKYSWYNNPYDVEMDKNDSEQIKSVTYQENKEDSKQDIAKPDKLVYVKLGGSPDRINNTVPKIANVLTDIENASRCKYDLRKNNHLFGRVTPYFKTTTANEAKSIFQKIQAIFWKVGKAFAGTADFSLVEPSGNALNSLKEELIICMKHISLNTGIPIQWLAYPELLSNRSTADNMIEMINGATIKERTIWAEALTELIRKAMEMSFTIGGIPFNKPNDFKIEIPQVSTALLKQIQETWIPLAEAKYVSKDTVRGKVPGIDPSVEKQLIEKEEEESMEKFNNSLLNKNSIGNAIENNNNNNKKEVENGTSNAPNKNTEKV